MDIENQFFYFIFNLLERKAIKLINFVKNNF